MIQEEACFINLKEVYNINPYCDYMKKMCIIRDQEVIEGKQESSVMNMLLMVLKKINHIRMDVLGWLSEHYYPDWQIMKNILYFVSKKAMIGWFQMFEGIMDKWQQNYHYAALFLIECQKAFEYQLDVFEVALCVEKSRSPHEFSLMIQRIAEKNSDGGLQQGRSVDAELEGREASKDSDTEIKFLMESIDFYKNQCIKQQAEIDALGRYKMQQELIELQGDEKKRYEDDILIKQQTETISNLEQENQKLRKEYDVIKEELKKAQLETERLKESKLGNIPEIQIRQNSPLNGAPESAIPEKKYPFFSKVALAIEKRKFNLLKEVKQREYIINHVMKSNNCDREYIMLLKQLMGNSNASFSFIFMLVKHSARKEELQAALLLLEDFEKAVPVTEDKDHLPEKAQNDALPEMEADLAEDDNLGEYEDEEE